MKLYFKNHFTNFYAKLDREKIILLASVGAVVLVALWLGATAPSAKDNPDEEIGVFIPKGQLVVPLELANAQALNSLVAKNAIVDVFQAGQDQALVENLRILKLTSTGEGPLFGALVPEKIAGRLQDLFSRPRLRGAIRKSQAGPTTFHLKNTTKTLITEITTGDEQ